jgi:hypothetical protein
MAVPAAASASPRGGPGHVSAFTGTSVFDFSTPSCSFAHQVFEATFGTRRHPGTIHVDGCATPTSLPPAGRTSVAASVTAAVTFTAAFTGTFTMVMPDRRHLAGAVTGSIQAPSAGSCSSDRGPAAVDLTLAPNAGTLSVDHTRRTFDMIGTWCSSAAPGVTDPVTGTIGLTPLVP